jgi:hypothetical protein
VKISERDVSVLLSEEGRQVLQPAALNLAESPFLWAKVEDSDDIGIWVRVSRKDGDHLVLIRWEYILSIDFAVGQPKALGLR